MFLPIPKVGCFFFFQAEDGIRDIGVTGVQTCALPILGAISTYSPVCESKTATLETLATTVPLRCLTWVNLPPTQILVPTCSIARTVPLTIGVWSGVSEGIATRSVSSLSVEDEQPGSLRSILPSPSLSKLSAHAADGVPPPPPSAGNLATSRKALCPA